MRVKKSKGRLKKKYPLRIYLDNGRQIPVPSQHDFKSDFIRNHGCSLVGFYMALRYKGRKKDMRQCLAFCRKNLKCYAKYSLSEISKGINKICPGSPATYYESVTVDALRKKLKKGYMVLFEEGNPIHTVVLLYNAQTGHILRFSDGGKKTTTAKKEIEKKTTNGRYRGCVVIK